MTKILKPFFFSSLLFFGACSRTDCDQLPKKYSSYTKAVKTIKSVNFKVEESINTSKSSWVREQNIIVVTEKRDYLFLKLTNKIIFIRESHQKFGKGLKLQNHLAAITTTT